MDRSDVDVLFKCVKENNKLRIKITSPGYHPDANCQFPRNIRIEGKVFKAPQSAVTFSRGPRGTLFYRVDKKCIQEIKIDVKVFDVSDTPECVVCMENTKDYVFIPCGHFCSCAACTEKLKECPICRSSIDSLVKKEEIT